MGLLGRYFSDRDMTFMRSVNNELLGDIIQSEVILFKLCAELTNTNLYGESDQSVPKQYYPGISMVCHIDRGDIATEVDDFGPNRKQNSVFKFMEKLLQAVNFFPQVGDLILYNDRLYQIDDVSQEQLLGNIPEKSFSIIVNTHYSKLSANDLVIVRQS